MEPLVIYLLYQTIVQLCRGAVSYIFALPDHYAAVSYIFALPDHCTAVSYIFALLDHCAAKSWSR